MIPYIDGMEKKDWGQCDNEAIEDFMQMATNFSQELDNDLNSMNSSGETCKVDYEAIESFSSDIERNMYYEEIFAQWLN